MEIVENNTTKKTNDAKVAKLEAKFEKAQKALESQEYTMELTKDSMTFLLTLFQSLIMIMIYLKNSLMNLIYKTLLEVLMPQKICLAVITILPSLN